ncbi:uncharacterized protein [Apostichopus japonicus]|uniref:uncharacterized protein isoform X2 n=1 Tax=Stichopus japonicus TaxID=307972 RepID=UPI003AB870D6
MLLCQSPTNFGRQHGIDQRMTSAESNLVWAKGRGRGFRPTGPFSPSRRPGEKKDPAEINQAVHGDVGGDKNDCTTQAQDRSSGDQAKHLPEISKDHKYIAKFNYKANPNSPLGEAEVDLKQGEFLTVMEKHKVNPIWWKVKLENGKQGFVPAKYVQKVEEKITTLPWLANKEIDTKDEQPPTSVKAPPKPYVSAYSKEEKLKQYYCGICEKQLNGPQPYSAHMASKDHKLEVEVAEERERNDAR